MANKPKFYITTPIYYPSDKLHIGHTYCTVATDAIARYKRLKGFDVMFLTGTDEHGQKIEDKAAEAGVTPKEFVDNIVEGEHGVKDLWKLMNISNDRFIRTTDDYHVAAIQKIFKKMYDNGDIYKGVYKGKYCKPCESFWTESQLVDGKCPDCGREVQDAEEEAYFFRLSKYADRVRDLLVNTDFLEPRSRVHEMVNNFIDRAWRISASAAPASPGASPWTLTPATWSTSGWTPSATISPPWAMTTTNTPISTSTGPRTSTSWARRSSASIPSSGPPC